MKKHKYRASFGVKCIFEDRQTNRQRGYKVTSQEFKMTTNKMQIAMKQWQQFNHFSSLFT